MSSSPGALFVEPQFLSALATTGCIGPGSGWSQVSALSAPAFLKTHSQGEFVFDWIWAQAAQQAGYRWYPKLILAAPFSPVTGPRLLLGNRSDDERSQCLATIERFCGEANLEVASINFCDTLDQETLNDSQWLSRYDWQFHWHNHSYTCFEEFLAKLKRRARKNISAERRKAKEDGWQCEWVDGQNADERLLDLAFQCYQSTHRLYGNHAPLTHGFFKTIAKALGRQFLVCVASQRGQRLAVGIFFRDEHRLYGRYWGSLVETRNIHFEVCYYQGIEYCIEQGLQAFEPGAQGEHKIKRGFLPIKTHSYHWLASSPLKQAIDRYLTQEARALATYREELEAMNPYQSPHEILQ